MEKKHTVLILILAMYLSMNQNRLSQAEDNAGLNADRRALEAFRAQITDNSSGILLDNWSAKVSVCNWTGVSCSFQLQPPRVIALDVSNMGLVGTLSPHIGNLSFLASFRITNNSFHGSIPPEISRLQRLEELYMGYNSLDGNIPEEIGNLSSLKHLFLIQNRLTGSVPLTVFSLSSLLKIELSLNMLSGTLPKSMCNKLMLLSMFYISGNQFEGQIPSNLYKCRELRYLSMSLNKFNGSIPREIGNLTLLKELYLGQNNLQGSIPVEIGKLMSLEVLVLPDANLRGDVPRVIFNMSSLRIVSLNNNSLSEVFPPNIQMNCQNLEELYLHNNRFNGPIPSDLWKCNGLRVLDLSQNQFTGDVPGEVGNLSLLTYLYLGNNNFTGEIPYELEYAGQLEDLSLDRNKLRGNIPFQLFNISTLRKINLGQNLLSGHLPTTMGFGLPNLEELYLFFNKFSGTLPSSIINASKLSVLDITLNSFSGTIPSTIGKLEQLERLLLGGNNLTSEGSELEFLSSLTNCRKLTILGFAQNQLNGILPTSIGNLSTSLQIFQAYDSKLKGYIPRGIGNLSSLGTLSLDNNELRGRIPEALGKLEKLGRLYLEHNRLEGQIPHDLCLLENLVELYLSDNHLNGTIPVCLGRLDSLTAIFLDSNKLTSTIPSILWSHKSLVFLNLSTNLLSGTLSLSNESFAAALTTLDLSLNQLSGDIPSTLSNYQMLNKLSLAHNKLQGPIPKSLGTLISLELLDLSNNNLSGVIPRSLEALRHLQCLNLSYNMLEGEVPSGGRFSNFTTQSFMGNKGLCGTPRLDVPLCKSKSSIRRALSSLKYILPIIASAIVLITVMYLLRRGRRQKVIVAESSFYEIFRVSYYEILRATESFSEAHLIGKGAHGSVYKGKLQNGVNVAVKVFNLHSEHAVKSFDVECQILRNTRHRNLVRIISSCTNMDFKCLVMEYMSNGNLDQWLYSDDNQLTFGQRLQTMIDVASAVEYLHHGQTTPTIHCDLKPTNVLLDEDMTARVCDFGVAKVFCEAEFMAQTTTLGTIGYMAPEYGTEGIASTKSDVYSFGILLLETFTGKKPTDEMFSDGMSLRTWALRASETTVFEVADASLIEIDDEHLSTKEQSLKSIFNLAMDCTIGSPNRRIDMKEAFIRLHKIQKAFLGR